MKFRTEIEPVRGSFAITHADRIVLLGSCFADNVGARLCDDGFTVTHNPLGPLFSPMAIARVLARGTRLYGPEDFVFNPADGMWHCLDFAARYARPDAHTLAEAVNADFLPLVQAIADATVLIVTFGTAKTFTYADGQAAGNCHRFPADFFSQQIVTAPHIVRAFNELDLPPCRKVFTLSPVRYAEGGLRANSLSKAHLRVAIDDLCASIGADYFPAYEMVVDDLRDYRFYAADLKHITDVAVDYIYQHFADAYFSPDTLLRATAHRRQSRLSAHLPRE